MISDVTNPGSVNVADQNFGIATSTSGPDNLVPLTPELLRRAPLTSLVALASGQGIPSTAIDAYFSNLFVGGNPTLQSVIGDEVNFSTVHSQTFGSGWLNALGVQPGKGFVPLFSRVIITAQAGVHVAAAQLQIGTNATINNITPTTSISVINLNNSIAAGVTKNDPIFVLSTNTIFNTPELNGIVPSMFVGTAITAGTTLRGIPWLFGAIVPLY